MIPTAWRSRPRSLAFAIVHLLGLAALAGSGTAQGGVLSLESLWRTKDPLRVCFFGGAQKAKTEIATLAGEWTQNSGISFDFGKDHVFYDCGSKDRYDIRIGFARQGYWSYIGVQARASDPKEITLNLENMQDGVDPADRGIVLHQFGHALGLMHEEQDPESKCAEQLDRNVVQDHTRWPQYAFEVNVAPVAPDNGRYLTTGFDRHSVMRQFTSPLFFKEGVSSSCYGPPVHGLSQDDRRLIQRAYPPRPPDVSATQQSARVAIRFEGLHASEFFGHVLDALYEKGYIKLKKHVDIRGVDIRQVIVEEKLTPRIVVSDSYYRFLCKVNPHICSPGLTGGLTWRNDKATKNFNATFRECPDRTLETFVFCLPNIRLEAMRGQVTDMRYSLEKGHLRDLVTTLEGCDIWGGWSKSCQELIKNLNPDISGQFLSNGDLPPSFAGVLAVPDTHYRLSIEYSRPEDRKAISYIVAQVRSDRSRALGIPEREIAIRDLDPIGNPKTQQARLILSEPAPGYAEVLRTMSYPFRDEKTEAVWTWPSVDVAVWDSHVHVQHCEFRDPQNQSISVVLATPSQVPTDEAPPDVTAECAKSRLHPYRSSARWDHGTSVTGIIAAQVNGVGIAGVNPRARVWAWEVLSGDQITKGISPRTHMAQLRVNPSVINISQSWPLSAQSERTDLEVLLFGDDILPGLHNRMLFVAAAGVTRDGAALAARKVDMIEKCGTFPACGSNWSEGTRRNLISVVALNKDGTALLASNGVTATDHGEAFDVSAIGETSSTMYGNWMGGTEGTSIAAPYVTGLASLLIAKARSLDLDPAPSDIKRRILATADRLKEPHDSGSRFGRINFERALDFERDIVILRSPSQQPCPGCRIVGMLADRFGLRQIRFIKHVGPNAQEDHTIDLKNIQRIVNDGGGLYTVSTIQDGGRLRKHERMEFRADEVFAIQTGAKKRIEFKSSEISDVTMCSMTRACGGVRQ